MPIPLRYLSTCLTVIVALLTFFTLCIRVLLFAILTRTKFLRPVRELLNIGDEFEPTGYTLLTKKFIFNQLRKSGGDEEIHKVVGGEEEELQRYGLKITRIASLGNCSAMQKIHIVDESQNKPIYSLLSKTGSPNVIYRFLFSRKPESQVNEGYFYKILFNLNTNNKKKKKQQQEGNEEEEGQEQQQQLHDKEFDQKLHVVRTYAPRVYHFAETPFFCNFLLLMEDLTHHKYTCLEEYQGATMQQCKNLVTSLTKIHATLCNEGERIKARFPFIKQGVPLSMYDPEPLISFDLPGEWKKRGLPLVIQQEGKEATAQYEDLEAVVKFVSDGYFTNVKKLVEELSRNDTPQTLTHGDFRLDNLAYRHHDDAVKLLDWQVSCISSPVVDVVYFLMWAARSAEVSNVSMEAFHDEILRHHYQELMKHENFASQFPNFSWQQYMHLAKTCVPLLMTMFVVLHGAPTRLHKLIPSLRKSLNTMVKNWKIRDHLQTFLQLEI